MAIEANAHIIGERKTDFRNGPEQVKFSWEGGDVALIDNFFLRDEGICDSENPLSPGDVFTLGALRLRVIGNAWGARSKTFYVMRDGWRARLRYLILSRTHWLDMVYRRLIITLSVWRLAEYNEAVVPSWRDVHGLRWAIRQWCQLLLLLGYRPRLPKDFRVILPAWWRSIYIVKKWINERSPRRKT